MGLWVNLIRKSNELIWQAMVLLKEQKVFESNFAKGRCGWIWMNFSQKVEER